MTESPSETSLGPTGVTDFKVGDRGAYAGAAGGYAEERVLPADRLVKLPDSIDYKTAAAMMLKGMTAEYLLNRTYKVGPDTTLLFHAAAGGVGHQLWLLPAPAGRSTGSPLRLDLEAVRRPLPLLPC